MSRISVIYSTQNAPKTGPHPFVSYKPVHTILEPPTLANPRPSQKWRQELSMALPKSLCRLQFDFPKPPASSRRCNPPATRDRNLRNPTPSSGSRTHQIPPPPSKTMHEAGREGTVGTSNNAPSPTHPSAASSKFHPRKKGSERRLFEDLWAHCDGRQVLNVWVMPRMRVATALCEPWEPDGRSSCPLPFGGNAKRSRRNTKS